MYNLFLDDERMPKNAFTYTKNQLYLDLDWVVVRNYDEFVSYIKENDMPDLISFDHDLADINYDEKTGYDCAKWLINICIDQNINPPNYMVHSMNNVGRRNIIYLIENYKKFLDK